MVWHAPMSYGCTWEVKRDEKINAIFKINVVCCVGSVEIQIEI